MKVFILTLHWVSNFGANLQAFSTYTYLKNKGVDVWVIDYRSPEEEKEYRDHCSPKQNDIHQEFVGRLQLTPKVTSLEEIVALLKKEVPDVVVVGSDAVWIQHGSKPLTPYWLSHPELEKLPIKFVSLAVSMMGTQLAAFPEDKKQEIQASLRKFSHISLRDQWSLEQIQSLGLKNVSYSSDPVFLLDEQTLPAIQNSALKKLIESGDKYIVVSISKQRLSDAWFKVIKKKANRDGYKLVEVPMPEGNHDITCDVRLTTPLSPADWYHCLVHAAGYIGERFHAMVTCVHNQVPFVIIDTYGSKLPSFANKRSKIFDLATRLNRSSYLIHKRNPLLFCPHYVYGKMLAHIEQMKKEKVYTPQLEKVVEGFIHQIL